MLSFFQKSIRLWLGGLAILITFLAVFSSTSVFAQTIEPSETFGSISGETFANIAGFGTESLTVIIARIIRVFLGFLGVIAVLFILYGGLKWMISGGDTNKVQKARAILINAVIGLVIVLSSYAIAQFVIDRLTQAVGGTLTEATTSDTYTSDTGDPSELFVLRSVNTDCSSIRNLVLQFVFSQSVSLSSLEIPGAIIISKKEGLAIEGTWQVEKNKALFTPNTPCGQDYPDTFCFDADTNYKISLDASLLKSTKGASLECTTIYPCSYEFLTGTDIDLNTPVLSMTSPVDNGSVYANSTELLQAFTQDDAGVSSVDFYLESDVLVSVGLDQSLAGTVAQENYFEQIWETNGYVSNQSYTVWAKGLDCSGNEGISPKIEVIMRSPNCDNGVEDAGEPYKEAGIDCGGEGEYYCGLCSGESCTTDTECASGNCEEGVCVNQAIIKQISPDNGAIGNFITISGDGFGNESGKLILLGDPQDSADDIIHEPTSSCGDEAWSDNQVIIELKEGSVSGPIEIQTNEGFIDRSNDTTGPVLSDFVVNQTVRPGICAIRPDETQAQSLVIVMGNNFGNEQNGAAYYIGSTEASSYDQWKTNEFGATIPVLTSGKYETQVFIGSSDNRQGSNKVALIINDSLESQEAPQIISVDSGIKRCSVSGVICAIDDDCTRQDETCIEAKQSGPRGQYLTLYGSNFGTSIGTVRFQNKETQENALGDTDFPDICEASYWQDDRIIIQVPEYLSDDSSIPVSTGIYNLWVVRTQDSMVSNTVDFTVVDGKAGPNICKIEPSSGPVGTQVKIYGEGFEKQAGEVIFYENEQVSPSVWTDTLIEGTKEDPLLVPESAKTGPIFVSRDFDGLSSNSINFLIGICNQDFACEIGSECCTDGTCRLQGTCEESTNPISHYAYYFSTGPIPETPQIVVACTEGIISPSPWEGYKDGDSVCVDAVVTATFSTDMDQASLNQDTIRVEKCLNDACTDTQEVIPQGSPFVSDSSYGKNSKFTWIPESDFSPSSLYQVTLRAGEEIGKSIRSEQGVFLESDYQWEFETASVDSHCQIGNILVSPDTYTATEKNEYISYLSEPTAAENACVVLNCTNYDWAWNSSNPSRASLATDLQKLCAAQAQALLETPAGQPVYINSSIESLGKTGTGELTINFSDPTITDYWPNCSFVCVNASLGAEFNTSMSIDTTASQDIIQLYECVLADELCVSGYTEVPIEKVIYDPSSYRLTASTYDLKPNTYYRVIISGDIETESGVALSASGANYGNDFSWRFKTKNDGLPCAIDRIEISPEEATATVIGQKQDFYAYPFGEEDECEATGQMLQAQDYTWSSWTATDTPDLVQSVDVADLYLNGSILLNENLPNTCNASCLHTGSLPLVAVCGDGILYKNTEDCDDGNTISGDGCSSVCLTEATTTCSTPTDRNCCGNQILEGREECDDGNTISGDGCSDGCLNEGSIAVSTVVKNIVCGNASIAYSSLYGGEECDDGNTISGDGCSAVCLREGSISIAEVQAVCGNTKKELGEDCDDGNTISGDGCSAVCLREGSSLDYSSPSVCGNGGEPEMGEDCDDGNTISGDGCSSKCLLEGSSFAYETISLCGDGVIGTGEECDATTGGTDIAPYTISIITNNAPQEVTASKSSEAISKIQATSSDVTGDALLTLECACSTDAMCEDIYSFGCGFATGCCYKRPEVLEIQPQMGTNDVCRNTAIWVAFDQNMDSKTFSSITLEVLSNDQGLIDEINCPYVLTQATDAAPGSLLGKVWLWIKNMIPFLFSNSVEAAQKSCIVPVEYTSESFGDGMKISLKLSEALLANHEYRLIIQGDGDDLSDGTAQGITSTSGVGIASSITTSTFTTGSDVCNLDYVQYVQVEDQGKINITSEFEDLSPRYFSEKDETHAVVASTYSLEGSTYKEIQPIDGVYNWSWSGTDSSSGVSFGWGTTLSGDTDAIVVEDVDISNTLAKATGKNGTERILAQAFISEDTIHTPSTVGIIKTGSVSVTAFVCENPWPSPGSIPYVDDISNFSFFYCRDAGLDGVQDDLPGLTTVDTPVSPINDIFQELLFLVDGTSDVIGVRILSNPSYLSPSKWYKAQGFTGSPFVTSLDGYEAVLDGATLYVAAANQTDSQVLYSNIYVISYNADAQEETQEIIDQLLDYWSFNANEEQISQLNICETSKGSHTYLKDKEGNYFSCESDFDCIYQKQDDSWTSCDPKDTSQKDQCLYGFCDGEKSKIQRDLSRLIDMQEFQTILEDYGQTHRHCSLTTGESCQTNADCPSQDEVCKAGVPKLSSGSFIRSFSTSVWPSWASILANEVGTTLPVDPLNSFFECPSGSDSTYCWDDLAGQFTCQEGSHVYLFESFGGETYNLYTQLEYNKAYWNDPLDDDLTDEGSLFAEYAGFNFPEGFYTSGIMCDGTTIGSSLRCGDGVLGTDPQEECELGQSISESCTIDGRSGIFYRSCINDAGICRYQTSVESEEAGSSCIAYACGNGVIEGTEICDDGSLNGTYGFCGIDCTLSSSFYCGDGTLAGGEECDRGSSNGQYSTSYIDGCAFDCTFPGPSCGDLKTNGPEQCDGDIQSWGGKLCGVSDLYTPCETNDDCKNSSCGDGAQACATSRVCVGGDSDGLSCTSDSQCPLGSCSLFSYDLLRTRTCGNTCQWNSWSSSCKGGETYCGNGIVEGTEICDDGNISQQDACTNTCQPNVCGDGYLYAQKESCDTGAKNGLVCTPDYKKTCSYCTSSCHYTQVSGAYCGNGVIENNQEFCDGSASVKYCFKAGTYPEDRASGATCTKDTDCETDKGFVCLANVGICNGGNSYLNNSNGISTLYDLNGSACVVGNSKESYTCGTNQQGICIAPVCESDCNSSCPFMYDVTTILAQSELAGSTHQTSVELYSYLKGSPDTATLSIPACKVGASITADIDMSNVTPPSVDVVFVTDLSGSMASVIDNKGTSDTSDDSTRIQVAVEATTQSIRDLFDAYSSSKESMRISTISYANTNPVSGRTTCISSSSGSKTLSWVDYPLNTVEKEYEMLFDPVRGVTAYLGYTNGSPGTTPTAAGLSCASNQLASSKAEVKIIILLSDGEPNVKLDGGSCSATDCINEIIGIRDAIVQKDIQIYTAAITTQSKLIGYMAHFSSDTCKDDYEDVSDCTPTDNVEYAYNGSTSEELETMYETIINSILGLNIGFTTKVGDETVVTTGVVQQGEDVELPFPMGFSCPSTTSEWNIPIRVNFNGEGTVVISDISLTYCPLE